MINCNSVATTRRRINSCRMWNGPFYVLWSSGKSQQCQP